MNNRRAAVEQDEDRGGIFHRLFGGWEREEEYDDEFEEHDEPVAHRGPVRGRRGGSGGSVVRLATSQGHGISRRTPQTMDDAKRAAEDLKNRRPVILNLEDAPDEVAQRSLDFISGVTYALNGFYQKVASKVFLFTPSDFTIQDEDETEPGQKGIYEESGH